MVKLLSRISVALLTLFALSAAATASEEEWEGLREDVFGDRKIEKAGTGYKMYIPSSAKDASIVPLSLRISSPLVDKTSKVYILIDRNPAPVAATITFGDAYRNGVDIGERRLDTRIRIDSFSQVRAVFETTDGKLHMAAKFVAGAGGCSAVGAKDPEQALALLGRIRVKVKTNAALSNDWREGVVMIRHPNFTGMQMDQKTGEFTPAWFVDKLEVKRGGKLMFEADAGISISEDPNIRFTYGADKLGDTITVKTTDTRGGSFLGSSADGDS